MQAAVKATRRAARVWMKTSEREGLLFEWLGLAERNCIKLNPPTAVLLPDFRKLTRAEDGPSKRQSGIIGYRRIE
jgi:hypothetical protein